MSADRSGKSHALAWVVTIIVAVPTFYILSVPPLTFAITHGNLRKSDRSWVTISPPPWLRSYAQPYQWLRQKTPLAGALEEYGEWCGYAAK